MAKAIDPKIRAKACEEILAKVKGGMSLRAACEGGDDWTPSEATFRSWCDSDTDLSAQYASAREARAEVIFEQCLAIADSQEGDVIKGPDGGEQINHDAINRAKLRIDTRKWMLGKMQPKTYGDKQTVDLTGSFTVTISGDDADL
ncbi:MAG: ubiquitin carboxyl-hydrolase [Pseudomonadota bacterium]